MILQRKRTYAVLFIGIFLSSSLHSIPIGPLTKPFTKFFSKQANNAVELADGSASKLSRNFSDDLSRLNKLNVRLIKSFPSDSNINYLHRLDEKFAFLNEESQAAFIGTWKKHANKNNSEVAQAYKELTSISKNETIDSFVIKLGKIEGTLIAGIFGVFSISTDAEAAKGGLVDTKEFSIGHQSLKIDEEEYMKITHALKCFQAFEISNIRSQKTYSQFHSQVPKCPPSKPSLDKLEDYLAARISK
jgi:hypothetical protein